MTDAAPQSIGIVVTAEQIPLLRDIIVAQQLDVYLSDTQNTLLLDDQWKPWIRRVRPQRAHCVAAVWLIAPCYSWPDQHSHPRIRTIIAEQLQSCIQMAVMLGATGLVLPIEHMQPAFHARILYYLNLINDQLVTHNLTLMLGVTESVDIGEILQFMQNLPHPYPLLIESHRTVVIDELHQDATYYAQITCTDEENEHTAMLPDWANQYVVGANENVSLIRKKVQWAQTERTKKTSAETIAADTAEPEPPSRLSVDDEIA